METPKKLKVWSHNIEIKKQKDPKYSIGKEVRSALGYYDSDKQVIVLKNSLKDSQEIEILIHELLHSINYYTNVLEMSTEEDRLKEEKYVDTMAAGLTLLLKDNPELIDYIKEKLHDNKEERV